MSGSDKTRRSLTPIPGAPAVILITPQLGENIGMAARAMLNCAMSDLRLVRPRDGWPNPKALATAVGASDVVEQARIFDTTADAIADLQRVYATTARPRDMSVNVATPEEAATQMRAEAGAGAMSGVLFGPESSGMDNDDIVLADTVITVPLNPGFSSLNLAQAVFAVGYCWYRLEDATPPRRRLGPKSAKLATREELLGLFEHLERELDEKGFLSRAKKRPSMVRNLRNIFQRAHLSDQEVRTLRGVITSLTAKWIRAGSKTPKTDG
jgi:tRNA/rRNA methyltransferase